MPLITFDNFYEEVKLFCHGQPKKADGLGVIVSDPNSDLAKVWIGYAMAKGWDKRAQMWAQMLKSGCKLTMPCADPRRFEPGFVPVPRAPERAEVTSRTVEDRRLVVERARKRVASANRMPNDRRQDWEPPQKSAKELAMEFLDKAQAAPGAPPMSPELQAKLGIRPPAQDAAE